VDREQKILVEEKEFSNLYEDMAKEFLTSLKFDNSVSDNNNQLLFLSCFENSLSYFADEIYENFKNDIDPIDKFNNLNKWRELSKIKIFSNIISEEIENNGFINQINDSKYKVADNSIQNLIISNESNTLKKFNSLLDKYKTFKELLRKMLHEC
tara:strand:- start:894 stop:1355 length:462 start_codon:yes stop_codon:yes gene_type:complete